MDPLVAIADYLLPGLGGHLMRVGDKSAEVAAALGLDQDRIERIGRAGLYHDIGKLAWPEYIRQGNRLSAADFQIIYSHPVIGAEMLESWKDLNDIAPMVRYHHERFDGDGLPDGLAGEEIPLGARIISVCDVADAITMERTYDPARPHQEMVKIIKAAAGSQLDPEVVAVYLDLFET